VHLRRLHLADFRNYRETSVGFPAGLTVVIGDNGQGKTNLIEAIGYLARGRGPESRTVCYPVADALPGLAALQPAPDPLLDHRLAAALATLRAGADACTRGLPATGLRWLRGGETRLGEADALLASYRSLGFPVEHSERGSAGRYGGTAGAS